MYKRQALLFAVQTGISSELTAGEQLRAKLVAHEENACDFVSVTEDTGAVSYTHLVVHGQCGNASYTRFSISSDIDLALGEDCLLYAKN